MSQLFQTYNCGYTNKLRLSFFLFGRQHISLQFREEFMWMGGLWKFQVEPCHGTGNKIITLLFYQIEP